MVAFLVEVSPTCLLASHRRRHEKGRKFPFEPLLEGPSFFDSRLAQPVSWRGHYTIWRKRAWKILLAIDKMAQDPKYATCQRQLIAITLMDSNQAQKSWLKRGIFMCTKQLKVVSCISYPSKHYSSNRRTYGGPVISDLYEPRGCPYSRYPPSILQSPSMLFTRTPTHLHWYSSHTPKAPLIRTLNPSDFITSIRWSRKLLEPPTSLLMSSTKLIHPPQHLPMNPLSSTDSPLILQST